MMLYNTFLCQILIDFYILVTFIDCLFFKSIFVYPKNNTILFVL